MDLSFCIKMVHSNLLSWHNHDGKQHMDLSFCIKIIHSSHTSWHNYDGTLKQDWILGKTIQLILICLLQHISQDPLLTKFATHRNIYTYIHIYLYII